MNIVLETSIPNGNLGVPYSHVLTASGGTAPYTFSIQRQHFPPGITLETDGTIHGTPTVADSFLVYVYGIDVNGVDGSECYTIQIAGQRVDLTHSPLASYAAGDPVYVQFTAGGGTPTNATFNSPGAVVQDSNLNLFVADTGNSTIRKIAPNGTVTTFAGVAGATGSANGTGSSARFDHPADLTIDTSDNLYVADTNNHTIRMITPGAVVTTIAGTAGASGYVDANGAAARFNLPTAVAAKADGTVFVIDTIAPTPLIRIISPTGDVTTFTGITNGVAGKMYYDNVRDFLFIGSTTGNNNVGRWDFVNNRYGPVFGTVNAFAVAPNNDTFYTVDNSTYLIGQYADQSWYSNLVGDLAHATEHGYFDGYGNTVRFNNIISMWGGPAGDIFFTDAHTIRKLSLPWPDNLQTVGGYNRVTTIAGLAGSPGSDDGGPAYTWSFGSETVVPPELSLSSGGLITGACPVGEHEVFVHAVDPDGFEGVFSCTFTDTGLRVTTVSTVDLKAQQSYFELWFTTIGGYEPYQWEVADPGGALKEYFNLNGGTGRINGDSDFIGNFTSHIRVTDSNPNPALIKTAAFPLQFSIHPPPTFVYGMEHPIYTYTGVPFDIPDAARVVGGLPPNTFVVSAQSGFTVPLWLSIVSNPATGVVSYSGTPDTPGMYLVNVDVHDVRNYYAVWGTYIAIGVVDTSVGIGGQGLPTITYYNGNDHQDIVTEIPTEANIGGTIQIYGGVGPYTITALDTLPPGTNVELFIYNAGVVQRPVIKGTFTTQGEYTIPFRITDSVGNVSDYTFYLKINKKLHINHTQLGVGLIGVPYSYKITDNYFPGDINYPTTYTIDGSGIGNLPSGITIYHNPVTNDNFIQGTTSFSNAFPITIGGYTQFYSGGAPRDTWNTVLYIGGIVTVDHVPTPLPLYPSGGNIDIQFTAHGGSAPYTWAFGTNTTIPTGLTIDATGFVTGIVADGVYPIYVTAFDALSRVGIDIVTLYVGVHPLSIEAVLPTICVPSPYSHTPIVSGGTLPYTYTLFAGSLPNGLTLESNGLIHGTPTTTGPVDFTLRVVDSIGLEVIQPYQFTIATCLGVVTIDQDTFAGCFGGSFFHQIIASGGIAPYTYSLPSGVLPPSLILTGDTLLGVLSQAGTFHTTLNVTDATSTTTTIILTFTVTGLYLDVAGISPVKPGIYYEQQLVIHGVPVGGGTISLDPVQLPTGLTYNSTTQIISGTTMIQNGIFPISTVLDSGTCQNTFAFSLIVYKLQIEPFSLCVIPGIPFYARLTTLNGISPFTWTIASESAPLPDYLTLNSVTGEITGSAATEETVYTGVNVIDGLGNDSLVDLTITVNSQCPSGGTRPPNEPPIAPGRAPWIPSLQSKQAIVAENFFGGNLIQFLPSMYGES